MAEVPSHLLLLPPPPWPPSPDALGAAYQQGLSSTLQQIAESIRSATVGACLDIAIPVPILNTCANAPRGLLFKPIQALVAGIYKLICTIAARGKINVEDAEGINARVLLIAHPRDSSSAVRDTSNSSNPIGPVITLDALISCQRRWQSVFAIESEQGEELLKRFTTGQDQRIKVQRVPGGPIQLTEEESIQNDKSAQVHSAIAVGGTWDHIHSGHKLLLTMFAFLAQPESLQPTVLTIGITGDELLKNKKYADLLESWHQRQRSARSFLGHIMDFRPDTQVMFKEQEVSNPGPNGHAVLYEMHPGLTLNLVEIADPFGPTITDEEISALIVSGETRSGGRAVNDKRRDKGWQDLEVFEVDVLDPIEAGQTVSDTAFESKISSTAIRQALSERGRLRSKA